MGFIDRSGALNRGDDLRLELGCGESPTPADVVGIDQRDLPSVDVVGDIYEVLASLPDGCVQHVGSRHFFEHVEQPGELLAELGRVMKSGATMTMVVPHWSSPYFYSDPTHTRFYGLYSLSYMASCALFQREVPNYGDKAPFDVLAVYLVFGRETRSRLFRRAKRAAGTFINVRPARQEFYEAHLAKLLSCSEIDFRLLRT